MKLLLLSIGVLFFTHDYFISICDIEYNAEERTLEIGIKVTTHDLEDAADQEHLGTDKEAKNADDKILTYLKKHLSFTCDERLGTLEWVGKQVELEDTWIYVQISDVAPFTSLKVFSSILCTQFEEQQNRVNLKMPGQKIQGTVLSKNRTEYEFIVSGK